MTADAARSGEEKDEKDGDATRLLGQAGNGRGPLLICVAGMHGNEPAGVHALRRVFSALAGSDTGLKGEIVGLAGNLTALAAGKRFIDSDLNRTWTRLRVRALDEREDAADLTVEEREQKELLVELRRTFNRNDSPRYILDLHTTSGEGGPFAVLNDTLENRKFAMAFPVTVVLGVAENLGGTLLDLMNNLGHVNVGFEAGQHDDPRAVEHAEAAIWIAMAASGLIENRDPRVRDSRRHLTEARGRLPRLAGVRYRHAIHTGDGFRMEPGFRNFQRIETGQLLARDEGGEIRSKESGRVLMPLYQELGEDGFFLIREFKPLWLRVSAWLRRLGIDSLIHWLPGVKRHPELPATYVLNRRVALWHSLDIVHLLGYRKKRTVGNVLLISRRDADQT